MVSPPAAGEMDLQFSKTILERGEQIGTSDGASLHLVRGRVALDSSVRGVPQTCVSLGGLFGGLFPACSQSTLTGLVAGPGQRILP